MKKIKYFFALIAFALTLACMFPVIALADDIFTTGGTVSPEKDIYYVGDTVEIDDYFRNKSANNATNVSVEYYYRLDGSSTSVYSGSPISFGTIAGGASESRSYTYTFKESDIGRYRIGSKITYMISGGGPYREYSTGHDFTVMAAPTPTATPVSSPSESPTPNTTTPSPTPSPTPEPTEEPTQETTSEPSPEDEATAVPTPIPTFTPTPAPKAQPTQPVSERLASFFQDNKVLAISIIVLAVSLTALIILIIIVAPKKRRH